MQVSLGLAAGIHEGGRAPADDVPTTIEPAGEDVMDIVVWLLVGLVAGAIARFLVPGRDPMGWLGTLVLGLVGSLIGGFLGELIGGGDGEVSPAGLLGSIVGAIIALLVYRAVSRRSA